MGTPLNIIKDDIEDIKLSEALIILTADKSLPLSRDNMIKSPYPNLSVSYTHLTLPTT